MMLSIGAWFSQNWMIIVLIVLAVAFLVPTYLRSKKEANAREELTNSIKKGTKIVTTAGVYGVVDSIENTTDGKVVTILTGSSKNPSTMSIHINAIMGIDNKSIVVEQAETITTDSSKDVVVEKEQPESDKQEKVEDTSKKVQTKKKSSTTKKTK